MTEFKTQKAIKEFMNNLKCLYCQTETENSYTDVIYDDRIFYYGWKCPKCKKEYNFYATLDDANIEKEEGIYVPIQYKLLPEKKNVKRMDLKIINKHFYAVFHTYNTETYVSKLIYPTCWY